MTASMPMLYTGCTDFWNTNKMISTANFIHKVWMGSTWICMKGAMFRWCLLQHCPYSVSCPKHARRKLYLNSINYQHIKQHILSVVCVHNSNWWRVCLYVLHWLHKSDYRVRVSVCLCVSFSLTIISTKCAFFSSRELEYTIYNIYIPVYLLKEMLISITTD